MKVTDLITHIDYEVIFIAPDKQTSMQLALNKLDEYSPDINKTIATFEYVMDFEDKYQAQKVGDKLAKNGLNTIGEEIETYYTDKKEDLIETFQADKALLDCLSESFDLQQMIC